MPKDDGHERQEGRLTFMIDFVAFSYNAILPRLMYSLLYGLLRFGQATAHAANFIYYCIIGRQSQGPASIGRARCRTISHTH